MRSVCAYLLPQGTVRGFSKSHTIEDILHCGALFVVYISDPASVLGMMKAYLITDVLFHMNTFVKNVPYTVHHVLTYGLVEYAQTKDFTVAKDVVLVMETGLLAILSHDIACLYNTHVLSTAVARVVLYSLSRVVSIYLVLSTDTSYATLMMPLLLHNAYVVRRQFLVARSLYAKACFDAELEKLKQELHSLSRTVGCVSDVSDVSDLADAPDA